jgi:hypothetical protein
MLQDRKDEWPAARPEDPGYDSVITPRCTQASSQREAGCNHRHNHPGAG